MNTIKTLKNIGLVLLLANFAVGCASAPEEKPAEPEQAKEPEKQAEAPVAATSTYVVVKGDNLWNIAGKDTIYGNPFQWPLIYKANSDKIKDADLIYPGQNLEIDSNPSDADTAAAVRHAKTRGSWSIGATEDSDKAYLAK